MSHFAVLVLVPASSPPTDAVERLLAPYSENLEVPEHKTPCYCVGSDARVEINRILECELGSWDDLRARFQSPVGASDDERDAAWLQHLAPRREREAALQADMADALTHPAPDCESCHGLGENNTTYNPQSKWDWYQIGGRWTGLLSDYQPELDPANLEPCSICGGSGLRNDQLGRDTRATNPAYTCNGCDGLGTRTKWPTEYASHAGDIAPASTLAEAITDSQVPYALVTPDGEWRERGRMGWFGMSSGDKPKDDWLDEVKRILADHRDSVAVVVDCHI